MDALLRIIGGGLLCAVAAIILRQLGRDGALPVQWMGVVMLSGAGLLLLQPVMAFAAELCALGGLTDTASMLLRALGVAYLTQLCADLCRQSGEGAIAQGVENAGRIQLLQLALPQLRQLVELAKELTQTL